jgi:predicted extracellular nuclease
MRKVFPLIFFALILACQIGIQPTDNTGALQLQLEDAFSRTLEPEISMEADYYVVSLLGPRGEEQDYTLQPGLSLLVEDLFFGLWDLTVQAYNDQDLVIGQGQRQVQISNGQTTTVNLKVEVLPGEGALDLQILWNADTIELPELDILLKDAQGQTIAVNPVLGSGEAQLSQSLINGYYTLAVTLYDGEKIVLGQVEIVRIIKDELTSGTLDFSQGKTYPGSLDLNIDLELNNPLHPAISGISGLIGTGEPLVLTASHAENLPGVSYHWFVDGIGRGQGESFTFVENGEGPYRVDLVAYTNNGKRAGSSGEIITVSKNAQTYTAISAIQGAGHASPYDGQDVTDVLGVITGTENRGFWMQSPNPDGDAATSEGIYVYTYEDHTFSVGDLVSVDGTVKEYGFGEDLKLTELTFVTVTLLGENFPLPSRVLIGPNGILPPSIITDEVGTVYTNPFDPSGDAIDFYESLEGMLVEIENPVAVGGTKYGEIPVVPQGVTYPQSTPRGGLYLSASDPNPGILHLDTDAYTLGLDPIAADLGDTFLGAVRGVIGYSYGKFIVLPVEEPSVQRNALAKESTTLTKDEDKLSVATFNIENFPQDDENMSPAEIQTKIEEIAQTIVSALNGPDIVGLQEMTDDSYSVNDGTVVAGANYAALIQAIILAGGPQYDYIEIPPQDVSEGGWPGANIRVGYLYNPSRVGFTPAGNPGPLDELTVLSGVDGPSLSLNPGRFSVASFTDSRRSLAAEFTFQGETVFVINNHFNSKGGDQSLFGENQPPVRGSETERHTQANAVKALVESILALDPNANVVVLGDLNDFQFSETLNILKSAGLYSLTDELLPPEEQYTYIFNGNSQQLDHILASPALRTSAEVDIVHRYSEFFSEERATDHDPVLAQFTLGEVVPTGGKPFFSEYSEGSSNNKYLEIYNPSSSGVDLTGYTVLRYNNGSPVPSATIDLSGSLPAGGILVLMNSSADPAIVGLGDTSYSSATFFNGDDALQLVAPGSVLLDQIGIVGQDPGSAWAVAGDGSGTSQTIPWSANPVSPKGNGGDWTGSAGTGCLRL